MGCMQVIITVRWEGRVQSIIRMEETRSEGHTEDRRDGKITLKRRSTSSK
jgi:hypothetical protein